MPFEFQKLEIPEVIAVKPRMFADARGFFMELYKNSDFAKNGITAAFAQDNFSKSSRGTLRGLHFQKTPKAQGKLVSCIEGEIFDVAVDIRKGSPTFGKWVAKVLNSETREMLYIPPGFAHGFCVTSEKALVHYKATDEFSLENDRGIIWNDPAIGIEWPKISPTVSDKDGKLPPLAGCDNNFEYGKI